MHTRSWRLVHAVLFILAGCGIAAAQPGQPAPAARPDDTPAVKVGGLLFMDYTFQTSPEIKDADGNEVKPSSFNVTRAYINVTGSISHIVAFRVTPDVVRETGVGSSLNGSYTFRLKFALAQFNLDDWMAKGSWIRLGLQPTPYLEYIDPIYRYRFQGPTFPENLSGAGALTSADAGVAFHTDLPSSYGDVQVGLFNGEGYTAAEVNDQKAIQVRGSLRPFPKATVLQGLRVTGFYDGDHYLKDGEKQRTLGEATFEHRFVNGGFTYLSRTDRTSVARDAVTGNGWSVFVTPRTTLGWEGLFRYDHFKPNTQFDNQVRRHSVAGIAYWFPHQGAVSAALMLDYDSVTFDNFVPAQTAQHRIVVHGQVAF
jgi:hypothetical protein